MSSDINMIIMLCLLGYTLKSQSFANQDRVYNMIRIPGNLSNIVITVWYDSQLGLKMSHEIYPCGYWNHDYEHEKSVPVNIVLYFVAKKVCWCLCGLSAAVYDNVQDLTCVW